MTVQTILNGRVKMIRGVILAKWFLYVIHICAIYFLHRKIFNMFRTVDKWHKIICLIWSNLHHRTYWWRKLCGQFLTCPFIVHASPGERLRAVHNASPCFRLTSWKLFTYTIKVKCISNWLLPEMSSHLNNFRRNNFLPVQIAYTLKILNYQ